MAKKFQEILIREFRIYMQPVSAVKGRPDAIFRLLELMGWYVRPSPPGDESQIINAFTGLANDITYFVLTTQSPINSLDDLRAALLQVETVVDSIDTIRSALQATHGTIDQTTAEAFIGDLLNALTVFYLQRRFPLVFETLKLFTFISRDPIELKSDANGLYRIKNKLTRLHFDRIGEIISDPAGALADAYWPNGVPDRAEAIAVGKRFFPQLVRTLNAIGDDNPVLAAFGGAGVAGYATGVEDQLNAMLRLWWDYEVPDTGLGMRVGANVGILSVPDSGAANAPGIFVVPFGQLNYTVALRGWLLAMSGTCPAEGFQITRLGLQHYGGPVTEYPDLKLRLMPEVSTNHGLLIGSATGTRLEVKDAWLEAEALLSSPHYEISTYLRLRKGALVIAAGDGDGFLAKILPADGVKAEFDLGLGWSNLRGFHIEGSGSFEAELPLHLKLGPIEIPAITISAGFSDQGIPLSVGCDVRAKLGPLTAVVKNMGVSLDLSFAPSGGNSGPVSWHPGFKPPSGVGLSISGGGFTGGGYISFEPALHRYSGVLELEFKNSLALKAICLLDTQLPGGQSGYSLLIIISAEFSPIQLSFGFTLNGVGGLLGLNRTTDIAALRDGVRTGAVEYVLFPSNVVANATQIVSDLRQFFPPAEDRFIFGPMVKLGWGTPTLVDIELGLMVEGMSPWRILLPGVVRMALPTKDDAVLKLQVNFIGAWEEDKKSITFYASLFDSSLLSMPLTGSMAFLMTYGAGASFIVSAGGFNASFVPPPLPVPALDRMSLLIRNDSSLRIALSSYFAVTSNTVQFGCAVDLTAKEGKYSVEGHLGFDALFHFSPFSMAVSLSANLTLRRNSTVMFAVLVDANLTGPTPWSVNGRASFTICKIDISFSFSHVWGENRSTQQLTADVFAAFTAAIDDPANWQSLVPDTAQNLVTLSATATSGAALVLRPDGALAVLQKVVPLDFTINLFGNKLPAGNDRRFSITQLRIGSAAVATEVVREEFAPAQFVSLGDADKLSRKSFESLPAGAKVSGNGLGCRASQVVRREVAYEVKVVDRRNIFSYLTQLMAESRSAFNALLAGASPSRYSNSAINRQATLGGLIAVTASQEGFSLVHTMNMRLVTPDTTFASQAEAYDHMNAMVANDPTLADAFQIVPSFQARDAA